MANITVTVTGAFTDVGVALGSTAFAATGINPWTATRDMALAASSNVTVSGHFIGASGIDFTIKITQEGVQNPLFADAATTDSGDYYYANSFTAPAAGGGQ